MEVRPKSQENVLDPPGGDRRTPVTTTKFRNKHRRRPGDLSSLRRSLWAGIATAEELADNPDPAVQLRALHALSSLGNIYLRAVESADLERRIEELENRLEESSKQNGSGHGSS
jgi:hypothetical protein